MRPRTDEGAGEMEMGRGSTGRSSVEKGVSALWIHANLGSTNRNALRHVRYALACHRRSESCVCVVCVVRSYHVLQVLLAVAVRFDAQPHCVLVHEQGRCTQTPHDRNTVSS